MDLRIAILAESIEQHLELLPVGLPPNEPLHVIKRPDRQPREAGGNVPPHQDPERPRRRRRPPLVHLHDQLPRDVELADLAEDVDHEVVGVGVEGCGVEGVVAGEDEEGEGDLGVVLEAD